MARVNTQERLAVIENEIKHVKTDITEVKDTMKQFIACADEKYAEKTRVNKIDEDVDSLKEAVIGLKINWKLVGTVFGVIVTIITIAIEVAFNHLRG